VGYVSPEQIRGQAVDHRTDIFGFGAVLYEMLSGRRAFRGGTPAETLAAILKEDPPELAREGRGIPLALARIAHRCLEKRPEQRFHSAEDVAFALEALSDAPAAPGPSGERGRRRWPLWASLAVAAALAVGGAVWLLVSGGAPSEPVAPARLVPLTNLRGFEDYPALSPDGSRVAFSWNGETGADHKIYVKQIGTETPLRLTRDPGEDFSPTWSPDGRHIAFSRRTDTELACFVVPALGGPERRVHTSRTGTRFLDWSPDGKSLALTDSSAGGPGGIVLLSLDTLQAVPLIALSEFVRGLAFSPDGRRLAFIHGLVSDIYVVPVAGGEPRRLTFDNRHVEGLAWTRDGREIVFSSERAGLPRLWRVAASGGAPEPVTWGGEGATRVSIARDADRLAYARVIHDFDIWKVEVDGSGRGTGRSVAVIDSTAADVVPRMSPDRSRIAFASNRSGRMQIWACDADGTSCVQLSSDPGGSPRWSPDGREVAFDGGPEATAGIFVVDVETRAVRPLIRNPSDDIVPSWSADGRWVYFASNRSGSWQVWKTPAEGGRAVPVTTEGGYQALESPDGQFLYFSRTLGVYDIWRRPTAGGEETPILELPPGSRRCWDVGEAGLYYLNTEAEPRPAIELFDPVTGEVTRVAELEGTPNTSYPNLAISSDGRSIVYVQVERDEHDLMLIENFR
jgi:Tol biopolymer transport system component